jgi:hypothetical protein
MAASGDLMRAVRFHEYGDPSILRVDEVPRPRPRGARYWWRCATLG